MPAPHSVKMGVLERLGYRNAVWIESGTYHGETAAHLSQLGFLVHTIEPEPQLFRAAQSRFATDPNVVVHHGTASDLLTQLLIPKISPVNIWLDGHYSGPGTYRANQQDAEVMAELQIIDSGIGGGLCKVFIDDVRLFTDSHRSLGYPNLDQVVDWARKRHWQWLIELDILVLEKRSPMT